MTHDPSAKSAAGIAWDLTPLFDGPGDPGIDATLDSLAAAADAYSGAYRGTINVPGGPPAAHMLAALRDMERLQQDFLRVAYFAHLSFAANTADDVIRTLVGRVDEAESALKNATLFADLEWLALEDAAARRVADDPLLANYRHYLLSARRFKPHTLSEAEERVINEKELTGISAWQKFFTEFISEVTYPVEIDGEVRNVHQSEVLALLRRPDRALRRRAWESLYDTLGARAGVLSYIYDTRFNDHLVNNRMRGYATPIQPRNVSNDVSDAAVQAMMAAVERNFGLAHRYWALKARLLGLPKLELYDQYAPLFDEKEPMTYGEARALVLDALARFSPRFAQLAEPFFSERWIDADPRGSKNGGAFCAGIGPGLNPFILMNYNDDARDAMTLAHELGHGLHDRLAAKQTLLNYFPSLPVAETASVFAEMLVFDRLIAGLDDPRRRLAFISGKLEDTFATTFRQTVLTRFEELVYDARPAGRLNAKQLGDMWLQANAPYYGEGVNLTAGYALGWSHIPHFINTPFYCYAYAFGNLLVLALYGMYRREGESFVPKYTALLEAGSSLAPRELLASVGIDIHDPDFWQVGFAELERLVSEAEHLAGRL